MLGHAAVGTGKPDERLATLHRGGPAPPGGLDRDDKPPQFADNRRRFLEASRQCQCLDQITGDGKSAGSSMCSRRVWSQTCRRRAAAATGSRSKIAATPSACRASSLIQPGDICGGHRRPSSSSSLAHRAASAGIAGDGRSHRTESRDLRPVLGFAQPGVGEELLELHTQWVDVLKVTGAKLDFALLEPDRRYREQFATLVRKCHELIEDRPGRSQLSLDESRTPSARSIDWMTEIGLLDAESPRRPPHRRAAHASRASTPKSPSRVRRSPRCLPGCHGLAAPAAPLRRAARPQQRPAVRRRASPMPRPARCGPVRPRRALGQQGPLRRRHRGPTPQQQQAGQCVLSPRWQLAHLGAKQLGHPGEVAGGRVKLGESEDAFAVGGMPGRREHEGLQPQRRCLPDPAVTHHKLGSGRDESRELGIGLDQRPRDASLSISDRSLRNRAPGGVRVAQAHSHIVPRRGREHRVRRTEAASFHDDQSRGYRVVHGERFNDARQVGERLATLGDRDSDRGGDRVDVSVLSWAVIGGYLPLRIAIIMPRFLSPAVASVSLIVRPV